MAEAHTTLNALSPISPSLSIIHVWPGFQMSSLLTSL
jgi:hypothetical protein